MPEHVAALLAEPVRRLPHPANLAGSGRCGANRGVTLPGTSLVSSPSPYGVAETVDRLAAAAEARGMSVFARIDHGAGARAVGLELPEQELLLVGDPRVGTLLMQEDSEVGAELPLRVLVWASPEGVRVGFPDPEVLASAFRLDGRIDVLARMRSGLDALVAEATA